jgi:hypothetical protein
MPKWAGKSSLDRQNQQRAIKDKGALPLVWSKFNIQNSRYQRQKQNIGRNVPSTLLYNWFQKFV